MFDISQKKNTCKLLLDYIYIYSQAGAYKLHILLFYFSIMETKTLFKEFISSINTYENFAEYDDALSYLDWRDTKKKSYAESIQDFIIDTLDYMYFEWETLEEIREEFNRDDCMDKVWGFADGLVDIYFTDIYKSTHIFAEFVNDAKSEWLLEWDVELYKMIQVGQCIAYERAAWLIIDKLSDYFDSMEETK